MTDSPDLRSSRARRSVLPAMVAGLVIGALMSASLAPLLGAERSAPGAGAAGTPDFLQQEGAAGDGSAPATAPPKSLDGTTSLPGAPGGNDAAATGSSGSSAGGRGPAATSGTPAGGSSGAAPGPAVARTASDVGVTKDVIKIGAVTLKCGNCAAIGVKSAEEAPIVRAFEKDLNDRGGINGRQIRIATADYDPVDDAIGGGGSSREACIKLTEQNKVFAVVGGSIAANACIYDEHKTPLITERDSLANDPTSFNRAGGRLWTLFPSTTRTLLDWARQVPRQKLLPGASAKFGVVVAEGDQREKVQQVFVPELRRLGYTPTRVAVLPADPATIAVKASQEVSAMKGAGVTHVFMAADYIVAQGWIREAERNGFRPKYLASDFPTAGATWVGDQNAQAGSSWNGAIALSVTPDAEGYEKLIQKPLIKSCLDRYRRASGGGQVNNVNYGPIYGICLRLDRFVDAAKRAGANPTRQSLVQALATTGQFTNELFVGGTASWGGRYSLGAVRYSAATQMVRKVWKAAPCPYDPQWKFGCYVHQTAAFNMAA